MQTNESMGLMRPRKSLASFGKIQGASLGMRALHAWVCFRHWVGTVGRLRVRRLDHVTLPCHDLAIAEAFYVGVLGARVMLRIDEAFLRRVGRPIEEAAGARHTSVLFSGGARIDLFEQHEGQAPALAGHPHWAFNCAPGSLHAWRSRLNDNGIPTFGPTQLGPPGQASLYFNDPFGNHLELTALGYSDPIPIGAPDMSQLVYAWSPR